MVADEVVDKAADVAYGVYHPAMRPSITGKERAWRGPVETNPMRRAVRAALEAVAPAVELEVAVAAARGLARMVREEFPAESCEEIVNTWACWDITAAEKQAVAKLERAGLLDGP